MGGYIGLQALYREMGYTVNNPLTLEIEKIPSKTGGDLIALGGLSSDNYPADEEYYIQVKPLSFFKGLHYTDTYKDNQKMVDNAIYLSNKENKKFYVCIYEIDEENGVVKWLKNDNKICHEINHIYNLTENNIIIDLKFLSEDRLVM
jgi:hypothetical protein